MFTFKIASVRLLKLLRCMFARNPVIVGVTQLFLYEMGMTEPTHH